MTPGMDHNPILKLLDSATDYQRMQQALEGGKGPVAAFGDLGGGGHGRGVGLPVLAGDGAFSCQIVDS